jgi:hypothetical protein
VVGWGLGWRVRRPVVVAGTDTTGAGATGTGTGTGAGADADAVSATSALTAGAVLLTVGIDAEAGAASSAVFLRRRGDFVAVTGGAVTVCAAWTGSAESEREGGTRSSTGAGGSDAVAGASVLKCAADKRAAFLVGAGGKGMMFYNQVQTIDDKRARDSHSLARSGMARRTAP